MGPLSFWSCFPFGRRPHRFWNKLHCILKKYGISLTGPSIIRYLGTLLSLAMWGYMIEAFHVFAPTPRNPKFFVVPTIVMRCHKRIDLGRKMFDNRLPEYLGRCLGARGAGKPLLVVADWFHPSRKCCLPNA
jgi:hypothetical protein